MGRGTLAWPVVTDIEIKSQTQYTYAEVCGDRIAVSSKGSRYEHRVSPINN